MLSQEAVYTIVRQQGPIISNSIKLALNAPDTTMINVYLSELKAAEKISFTHLKLGTSSFAYTPEQIPKLETLQKHLNEKDQRTIQKLKKQQVLQASTQDPLTRVSLQETKDFAKPIRVTTHTGEELFFRYYLTTKEEAQQKIREILGVKQEEQTTPQNNTQEQQQTIQPKEQIRPEPRQETEIQPKKESTSEFAKQITTYCREKNITIHELEEIRSNSELEGILEVPSAVGNITFFAKIKNKKTSNDGDLASAILKAQTKQLPALYITTGEITKKAREAQELQQITVISIGS